MDSTQSDRRNLLYALAARLSLGALLFVSSACAPVRSSAHVDGVHPVMGDEAAAVARALGEQLRMERGPYVVFPLYLTNTFAPVSDTTPGNALRARLLEALRQGGRAQYADTAAYADETRRKLLPDSARYYFTFNSEPVVRNDTATIDVIGFHMARTPGFAEVEVARYEFILQSGRWQFIRRVVLYMT